MPGAPKVPTTHGKSLVVLIVKVPRTHMFYNFSRQSIQRMEKGLDSRKKATAKHQEKKHCSSYPTSVYDIVNEEPNAEECKAKVKKYEEENKSQIVIRQSQRADEDRSIADR